jgi:putative FmdB family regulatory protein
MPIFEFVCPECGKSFEELVRSSGQLGEVVCPDCGSGNVKKKISTFASRVSGGSGASLSLSSSLTSAPSCSPGGV